MEPENPKRETPNPKPAAKRPARGYAKARHMRKWADKKGGYEAAPDGFDRSKADTLASLIDEWFLRLEERNYSKRSVDGHKWALRTFVGWAEERDLRKPGQITKPILESYQRWLFRYRQKNGQPLGVGTQRSRLGAIQRFFAWLCRENRLAANPAADLELPRKQHRSLPKALSREEIAAVMSVPDISDPLGIRDRAILETLYATALRRREIAELDVEDLDLGRGVIICKGKGGKYRAVPIGQGATPWLKRYLEEVRPLLLVSVQEHAFFLTGYGERFNPNYIGNWVKRTLKKVGIDRPGSCHLLRHSCATHMHENGADIRFIQQMLGHARLDTTQIYTEVNIEHLKEVHARTHPSNHAGKRKKLEDLDQDGREA